MDGALVQSRLWRGYAKACAKAGRAYQAFRIVDPLHPLNTPTTTVYCMFGQDPDFTRPVKYKLPSRLLWADGSLIQPGDILQGPMGTLFVGDMQPLLPMQAVLCNEVLTISRPVYEGTSQTTEPIASAIPCFRQLKKVDQHPQSTTGAQTNSTVVSAEWFVWTPLPVGLVRQGDSVTDQLGRSFSLDTVDNTELGPLLTIRQADVNPIPSV